MPHVAGRALAALYGAIVARRNARFDRRKGVVEFDRPVISVGNLSVGGTGKTPLTLWLLARLRALGHWPALAMRGYRAPHGEARESDEAREYLAAFPDLPLAAGADRVEGLLGLFDAEGGERIDCVLLDDGFQHRRIARQLDIVLLDATRNAFADRLLPAGWLREPTMSLSRAGAVVLSRADLVDDATLAGMEASVRAIAPGALVAACAHAWEGLVDASGRELDVAWLAGKRVVMACAVGNPDAIERQLRGAGAASITRVDLRDHDPFEDATVSRVIRACTGAVTGAATRAAAGADACVVTAKDWTKLARIDPARWPCPVVRPRLSIRFLRGEAMLLERVVEALQSFDSA